MVNFGHFAQDVGCTSAKKRLGEDFAKCWQSHQNVLCQASSHYIKNGLNFKGFVPDPAIFCSVAVLQVACGSEMVATVWASRAKKDL